MYLIFVKVSFKKLIYKIKPENSLRPVSDYTRNHTFRVFVFEQKIKKKPNIFNPLIVLTASALLNSPISFKIVYSIFLNTAIEEVVFQ